VQDLSLYASWNLISSFVGPFEGDVEVVQRSIAGQYAVILGFEAGALSYYPDLPPGLNTLQTIDGEHGYWVKLLGDPPRLHAMAAQQDLPEELPSVALLRLVGQGLPPDHPIELEAGWNLVSYLPEEQLAVPVALQNIDGLYTAVLGFEPDEGGVSYYPDLDPSYNTLRIMKPGYGYWIKMDQPATLQYPAGTSGAAAIQTAPPRAEVDEREAPSSQAAQTLRAVTPTNTWVNFYGPACDSDAVSLPQGATVVAVDPEGVVCGAVPVGTRGQYGLLPCYGDDSTTLADEGAEVGDVIRLVVEGTELGQGTWTGHGERQLVPLGAATPDGFDLYLPLVVRSVQQPEEHR